MHARFENAPRFAEFLEHAQQNTALWRDAYRLARVPDDVVERARALPGRWHLLVLVEDWCGDAVNTVPYLARLSELVPGLALRVLGRDENPDLMDAHLAPGGARAIPVVIVYDAGFAEVGWWGSRPGPLQEWVTREGMRLEKPERYRHVRTWYARDRGRTTLDEVLTLLERSAAGGASAAPAGDAVPLACG